ncbi:MAG TPA: hypothetical protein VLF43_05440 [Candidatus Saccharimonadales bacterium]|nr:hypothetical protein [Candidatus Saccharimonadales bacterium]
MGNLDPSEFSKKEQDRYLDEMRSIQEWQGGKAGDWDEDKSLWVILSADLIPRGSGQEDGASLNLVLQGYSEAHQAWTSLRMYANIVQSRLSGHSDEGELIGAQLLSDSDPTECLVVPTLAQTVALSGIVHEACRIVQTGK